MVAPVIVPTSPGDSQLANKWVLQVDTAYPDTAAWVTVYGMSQFTPTISTTKQDNSDFDSDGWASQKVTQRGWSVTGTVQRKKYATAEDPGQGFLRAAAYNARDIHIRWFDRYQGTEANEGYASPEWAPQGGSVTDLESAQFTLNGQGRLLIIANPMNVAPTIATALPSAATEGQSVIITGTGFHLVTGSDGVTFGAVDAESYTVDSPYQITAVMPAGSAGSAAILVESPFGVSASFAYTRGA